MNQALGKQEKKSERARTTICRATVRCLASSGYAETSINRVIAEAGVSKGALQHHFPSKEDLMASTAAWLLAKPLRHAEQARSSQTQGDMRSQLIGIWERLMNTRAYLALLEILIASRTDKLLHARIALELKASIQEIDDQFLSFFHEPTGPDREDVQLLMTATRCLMRGLLIEEQYGAGPTRQRQVLERWLDLVTPELERKARAQNGRHQNK